MIANGIRVRSGLGGLRQCVRPELATLPTKDLEQIVNSSMSGLPHEAAEDFLDSLRSLGKAVAPTLERAAPAMAQGAMTGGSVGGPWGALIGAGAGLASSSLSTGKPAQPTAPAPAGAPPPSAATPTAAAPPPSAATAAPIAGLPTGQAAAATLASLLQNPTLQILQQALTSQALGAYGRQEIPTSSGASLPRAAVNNLLMQLLAHASEALPESESISEQTHLQGEDGEYLIDPASPEQQAALALSRVQSARAGKFQSAPGEFLEAVEWIPKEQADLEAGEWLELEEEWPESEESTAMARFY
jgi:hypothetical protein